jgi:carboxypeptidase Q
MACLNCFRISFFHLRQFSFLIPAIMQIAGVLSLALVLSSGLALAQQPPVVVEALKPSPIEQNLRKLTDEIGGRVPGTPAMEAAVQWGVETFKAAGADKVWIEKFEMPVSWAEGATAIEVVAPAQFKVRGVSMAWSPAIAKPLRARVIDVGEGTQAEFAKAGNFQGAVLLVHSPLLTTWEELFNEYLKAPPIIDRAVAGKAAAIAWLSSREHDVLYRHINSFSGHPDRIPGVLLAREDGLRVARLIANGKAVEMQIALPNKIGGAIKTANVIAELRGSEKPDEYVVLGAHLDSWDLGTGALDNGANCALVIDALRAIRASGAKPKRSIRFILYSGEEQGMHGSLADVRQHRSELDKVAGVVIVDSGIGKITGYSLGGRKDAIEFTNKLLRPIADLGATQHTTDAFVGTDNFDYMIEGVPTWTASQEPANYMVNYHASSDTYDKVDFTVLKRHTAIAAYTAFALADSADRVPRQSRAEVEQLLKDTKLDEQLKIFGHWPDWMSGKRGRTP